MLPVGMDVQYFSKVSMLVAQSIVSGLHVTVVSRIELAPALSVLRMSGGPLSAICQFHWPDKEELNIVRFRCHNDALSPVTVLHIQDEDARVTFGDVAV
jgi:hypothetical protein